MLKEFMMLQIVLVITLMGFSLGGTPCPPRENIYPCSCMAVPQGKRNFFTSVNCHHLTSTDALTNIFPALSSMMIDRFHIYDSFWEANNLEGAGEDKRVLPTDWLTRLKIREIEIVDTPLSSCFACNSKMSCRNDITTRFTAINSSSHEKICTLCDIKVGGIAKKFSWTGCMSRLQQFHFRQGNLKTVRADLFPLKMKQLTEVDLSHNSIDKVESNAFQNLIKLTVLKLSHNDLESLAGIVGNTLKELQELDVSWNRIKELSSNFIVAFPNIKTLVMNNNDLIHLKEGDWKNFPKSLRTINLEENPLRCDCNIRWINSTLPVHTAIEGRCYGPEEFEGMLIRRASRYLIERCNEEGEIGTRKRTKQAAVTMPMNGS